MAEPAQRDWILFRGIHFNMDDFDDDALAAHGHPDWIKRVATIPVFSRAALGVATVNEGLAADGPAWDMGRALEEAKKRAESIQRRVADVFHRRGSAAELEPVIHVGDFDYHPFDAIWQSYFGKFGNWITAMRSGEFPPQLVVGVARPPLQYVREAVEDGFDNPFVSSTTSLRNAIEQAVGVFNPAGAAVRTAEPDHPLIGRIFVLRATHEEMQHCVTNNVVVSRYSIGGRLHPGANAPTGDEFAWVGFMPHPVGVIDITFNDVAEIDDDKGWKHALTLAHTRKHFLDRAADEASSSG